MYPPSEDRKYDKEFVIEIAAAFQLSLAEVMVAKTIDAAREYNCKGILLGGGVAANAVLRQMFKDKADSHLFIPSPRLCTDNGAMIASCAYFMAESGRGSIDDFDMDVNPSLRLGID